MSIIMYTKTAEAERDRCEHVGPRRTMLQLKVQDYYKPHSLVVHGARSGN